MNQLVMIRFNHLLQIPLSEHVSIFFLLPLYLCCRRTCNMQIYIYPPPSLSLSSSLLSPFLTSIVFLFKIRRWRQLLTLALNPHPIQFTLNLLPALLPALNLGQPVPQLREFLFHARLFRLRAYALKLPFVSVLAHAEGEGVGVVAFEAGTCRYCDQSWFFLLEKMISLGAEREKEKEREKKTY